VERQGKGKSYFPGDLAGTFGEENYPYYWDYVELKYIP
jgi:hypothetical protein